MGGLKSKILILPLLLMVSMSITSCRKSQYEVLNLRMRRSASIRPLMSYGTVKFKKIHLDERDHLIILCLNNPSCLFFVRNTWHLVQKPENRIDINQIVKAILRKRRFKRDMKSRYNLFFNFKYLLYSETGLYEYRVLG